MFHPSNSIRRELDPTGLDVAMQQRIQARLMDRDLAAPQSIDLSLIHVHAYDVIACFRQAGSRHQTDVSRTENRDSHGGGRVAKGGTGDKDGFPKPCHRLQPTQSSLLTKIRISRVFVIADVGSTGFQL